MKSDTDNQSVRRNMKFKEAMQRYHAEIEKYIFSAEILCSNTGLKINDCQSECPFCKGGCTLTQLRNWIDTKQMTLGVYYETTRAD